MARIIIRGDKKYIGYLSEHLKKEHPSTKKRMSVKKNGGGISDVFNIFGK